jgi:hypothetical protein
MILTHIAIRALRDLRLGIRCESLERVKWHETPFGSSLGTPARPGLSFTLCVSAGTEPGRAALVSWSYAPRPLRRDQLRPAVGSINEASSPASKRARAIRLTHCRNDSLYPRGDQFDRTGVHKSAQGQDLSNYLA